MFTNFHLSIFRFSSIKKQTTYLPLLQDLFLGSLLHLFLYFFSASIAIFYTCNFCRLDTISYCATVPRLVLRMSSGARDYGILPTWRPEQRFRSCGQKIKKSLRERHKLEIWIKMPPVTLEENNEKKEESEETVSKPTIGIIYPPPEVRSILHSLFNADSFILWVWLYSVCTDAHVILPDIRRMLRSKILNIWGKIV